MVYTFVFKNKEGKDLVVITSNFKEYHDKLSKKEGSPVLKELKNSKLVRVEGFKSKYRAVMAKCLIKKFGNDNLPDFILRSQVETLVAKKTAEMDKLRHEAEKRSQKKAGGNANKN